MNNIKKIFAVLLIVISTDIISQPINEIECKLFNSSGTNDSISNPFGGAAKPNRTDLSGGLQAPSDSPAAVGVPKSLLIIFQIKQTVYANFLVTNSKALHQCMPSAGCHFF